MKNPIIPSQELDQSLYTREIYCLYEIAKTLNASLDLTKSLQEVLSILSKFLGMSRATVSIFNPLSAEITIEVAHDLSPEARRRGKYRLGEGITGRVVQTGEPAIVPRISQEPLFLNKTRSRPIRKESISFLGVPILLHGKPIGVLHVDRLFGNISSSEPSGPPTST